MLPKMKYFSWTILVDILFWDVAILPKFVNVVDFCHSIPILWGGGVIEEKLRG